MKFELNKHIFIHLLHLKISTAKCRFLSPPQYSKQPDIKTIQMNEMELGAPQNYELKMTTIS